ncbi:MAG TPA: hypothetical protein VGN76_07100 [Gemmatimonadales bacterium]|jgi:hypothetical protein|nr:hypothetical protein [Gemmatimonadales bacterium]
MLERPVRTSKNGPSHELPENLIERVQARVAEAAFALDRRANATRPKSHRRRAPLAMADSARSAEQVLAEQSLRRVFRDLGTSYRRFRKQTGTPLTPGLRDAAYNFRAEPSLTTLVAVAAFLDELDLLS